MAGVALAPKTSEHLEQVELFKQFARHYGRYPELRLAFAIPNGGKRDKTTAGKLKAEGVKAGVSDIFIPVARGGFHGMFLELKAGRNKPVPSQLLFIRDVLEQGYYAVWMTGWEAAWTEIQRYLELQR